MGCSGWEEFRSLNTPCYLQEPILVINRCGQSLWRALSSPHDVFYYVQYDAYYLLYAAKERPRHL
jgi:hypothetical protein